MDDFKSIIVKPGKNEMELEVINLTKYELIGKGVQGAVFRLSEDRCVKIFVNEKYCNMESTALKLAINSQITPKVYEVGSNYIVMEYIKGQTLRDYLQNYKTFPESMTKRVVFLFLEMKKLGFQRIDASLRHIYITNHGEFKVIDHVNTLKIKQSYPKRFLRGLKKRGLLVSFMEQVKKLDSKLYLEWNNELNKHYGLDPK